MHHDYHLLLGPTHLSQKSSVTTCRPSPTIQKIKGTMKFTKVRVLLVLGLFRQADTQAVTVTIGESGSNVFMEFSGKLTVFPMFPYTLFFDQGFNSDNNQQFVIAATGDAKCKYRPDFMFVLASSLVEFMAVPTLPLVHTIVNKQCMLYRLQ